MNQLALNLPVPQPDVPERKEAKHAIRCAQCHRIVWREDTIGGLCPECRKEHHAEITDGSVG